VTSGETDIRSRLAGVLPPVVTPFRADGSLDLAAFEANLEGYAADGLTGYLVLGSNGEASSLDEEEKLSLVRAARHRAGGRVLLVGTGLESTRATAALTRKVADLGADAVLVLTPSYYRSHMTAAALRAHFEAVADAAPLPVLLYSVPQFTGISWPPGLAAELAVHPRIAGIKESSGDVALLGRILDTTPTGFAVCCGSAPIFYPSLCLGARAGILAVAGCAPRPTVALYEAVRRGDHDAARRIQHALAPLAQAVTAGYGIAGLKLAVTLTGRAGGEVRAPLLPAPPSAREDLKRLLGRAESAV
jgi:dihydrodipicolinate synthase/N-acetylneuraminate lyase